MSTPDDPQHAPSPTHPSPVGAVLGAAARSPSMPEGTGRGGRVLVIEPDPDLQWTIARSLTVRGHRVVGATSAEAALSLVAEWPVEVVLVDAVLPGTPALELAAELRRRQPEVRVVLMGRELSAETRLQAHVAGVVACVVKPFRLEHLSELLEQLTAGLLDTVPVRTPLVAE